MCKRCLQRCRKRILLYVLGHNENVWILELFLFCTPMSGDNQKLFQVTHRVQGVVHAKFGWVGIHPVVWDPNKETDTSLLYI